MKMFHISPFINKSAISAFVILYLIIFLFVHSKDQFDFSFADIKYPGDFGIVHALVCQLYHFPVLVVYGYYLVFRSVLVLCIYGTGITIVIIYDIIDNQVTVQIH